MAKNKHQNEGQPAESKLSENEIERRLAALEKTTSEMHSRIFDAHKWVVTVLFSALVILLGVYGVMSKIDVRDATSDMNKRVDIAIGDMQKQFQVLAGDAFKKPLLEMQYNGSPLKGQTITVYYPRNQYPAPAILDSLYLKNIGDKKSDPLSIEVSCSATIELSFDYRQEWERVGSYDTNYLSTFRATRHDTLSPNETAAITPLVLNAINNMNQCVFDLGNVRCRIKVFYGGEGPVEADFLLKGVGK